MPTTPTTCAWPSRNTGPSRRWSIEVIGFATALADWVLIGPVVLGLLGGALLLTLRRFIAVQPWACVAFLLLIVICDGVLLERVQSAGPLSMTMGKWLPPFGISFTADVMGAGFALLAA